MFKKQADGKEVYFNWPARTGRVVTSSSVRQGIVLRDNILRGLFGVMFFAAVLLEGRVPTLGAVMALVFGGCFLERRLYLSRLPKVQHDATRVEVDRKYIRERHLHEGVFLIGVGTVGAAAMSYVLLVHAEDGIPLFLSIPLIAGMLIVAYVGFRVVTGKRRDSGR
jgi:hypothetical protein